MRNSKDGNEQNNDMFDENGYFIEEVDGKRANLPTEKIIKKDNNTKEPKAKSRIWKKIIVLLLLFLLYYGFTYSSHEEKRVPNTIIASTTNQALYTLYGTKDKRLDAYFSANYISSNWDEGCTDVHLQTGRARPSRFYRGVAIKDGEYKIEFPIFVEQKNDKYDCKYIFRSLKLIMKRKRDKESSSVHDILLSGRISHPEYSVDGTGSGGVKEMPGFLTTDKRYFQIADNTNYFCRTAFYEFNNYNSVSFHCIMKIKDGKGINEIYYPTKYNTATNSQFGVDKIESAKLKIDIFADDNGSRGYLYKYRGKDAYNVYGNRKKGTIIVPYPFQEIPESRPENIFEKLYNKIFNNKE